MESETTNINELPVNPSISSNGQPIMAGSASNINNVSLSVSESIENKPVTNYGEELAKQRGPAVPPVSASQTDIRQTIEQAANLGLTDLPNRDIPMNTQPHVTDETVKPNFIPQAPIENNNYVEQHIEQVAKAQKVNNTSRVDEFYNELQMPLLIAILFFIFQLPIFRRYFLDFLPSLHNKDGRPKLSGYIFNCTAFALIFYLINKGISYITDM